jgi:hypothetical protein
MYCEKQRAFEPVSIDLPATPQVGRSTFFNPAFSASALIAEGVMSGVPVIFCRFNSVALAQFATPPG